MDILKKMRNVLLIVVLLITVNLYGNEVDTLVVNSKIKDVTVFFDGAQISREVEVNVTKGKHLLVIEKLPVEINPQSIQINNNEQGEILSVKHDLTYPETNSEIAQKYEEKIKQEEVRFKEITNKINVYKTEEKILLDNSTFNNKNEGTTIAEIKEASLFYREKLNEIKQNQLKLSLELDLVKKKIKDLYKEQNKALSVVNKTYSRISFVIESETTINSNFSVSYYVVSAGWTPLYDFRVNNINKPLNIVYNANIHQSTGEDWNNVNLTLSTNTPSLSNTKPTLETWFINRRGYNKEKYSAPNNINNKSTLKGKVIDVEQNEPIPFAKVVVYQNNQVVKGGVTDFDGRYVISSIKSGVYNVVTSCIGYGSVKVKGVVLKPNKITFQDFRLYSSVNDLEEVVVKEYKAPLINKDQPSGIAIQEDIGKMPGRSAESVAATVGGVRGARSESSVFFVDGVKVSESINVEGYEATTNITSLEYIIDIPYSIPSNGNDYTVKIKEVSKPTNYVYYAIPKLDNDVFLVAEVTDWTQLDLLSGKSSIYYKGIFTGQSEIDVNTTKDTLEISLNRDKNIIVKRTLQKEKNKKQFMGRNIKETINWSTIVRNNKNEKVKVLVEDQFPISENKQVEIEPLEYSNGKLNG